MKDLHNFNENSSYIHMVFILIISIMSVRPEVGKNLALYPVCLRIYNAKAVCYRLLSRYSLLWYSTGGHSSSITRRTLASPVPLKTSLLSSTSPHLIMHWILTMCISAGCYTTNLITCLSLHAGHLSLPLPSDTTSLSLPWSCHSTNVSMDGLDKMTRSTHWDQMRHAP